MESSGNALVGIVFLMFTVGMMGLGVAALVFWIWMLIDCVTNTPSTENLKLIWILVILFTHVIGALIYFFVQRPKNPTAAARPT